jgi:hypothetical protein
MNDIAQPATFLVQSLGRATDPNVSGHATALQEGNLPPVFFRIHRLAGG